MNAAVSTVVAVTFRAPDRLWLLVAVVALVAAYGVLQLRSRRYAVKLTNMALLDSIAPDRAAWRRHVPAVLAVLCLAVLVGAFAKPASSVRVPRERATVIMAIDTSLSMKADDVRPTRIKAAQRAARQFIDQLPPKINLGLVTFNGTAVVRVSPTTDREAVRDAVDQMRLGERTAIGEAIYASLDAVKAAPPGPKGQKVPARIVLMSDGSTTVGRPNAQGAAAAKKAGIPVSTIAFGTDRGEIQLAGDPIPVAVKVDPTALRAIATATGGTAFTAASASELKDVYKNIGSSVGYTKAFKDVTSWFVGASLILLLISCACSLFWFSRLP
jgi:Ca-activated chloride channel family protein